MGILYQIVRKSQVFLLFYRNSTTFLYESLLFYVNFHSRYPSDFLGFLYILPGSGANYRGCHRISDSDGFPVSPGLWTDHVLRSLYFFSIRQTNLSCRGLTFAKFCVRFSLIKAVMKTRFSGKIPREDAVWCKASVPLPERIPLLSRREEMPCRVRPLTRQ